ncbi:glutathione S-transferase N-terminal domain-containing protein [Mangrovicoccus ximenensis]|uniref:glutathione S-transferase N-terminal domain-containing protein n=1 Tax=Mangrovicoccus ximenensis TaxID=1911570 RepID=UPI0022AB3288|nr:glutathione S-transferase N-terminal domain-containing protein [Mangrovicoccus ximenensis]
MSLPGRPIKLYWHGKSGHAHRAERMLSLRGLRCGTIRIDLAARPQKAPDYLEISRFGQIPAIEDGGTVLWDSCAILVCLAKRNGADGGCLPAVPAGAAEVQRWLSVAAGPLAAGPAAEPRRAPLVDPVPRRPAEARGQRCPDAGHRRRPLRRGSPEQMPLAQMVGTLDGAPARLAAGPGIVVIEPRLQPELRHEPDGAHIGGNERLRQIDLARHGEPRLDVDAPEAAVAEVRQLAAHLRLLRQAGPEPVGVEARAAGRYRIGHRDALLHSDRERPGP